MIIMHSDGSDDVKTKVLKALGRLIDTSLSKETHQKSIAILTELFKGKPMSVETFKEVGIDATSSKDEKGLETVSIVVPKDYLPNNMAKEQDSAVISFGISKKLDI